MRWVMDATNRWMLIRVSVWISLFLYFAFHTWKEWNRFQKSPKTITTEFKEVKSLDLPDIFICDRFGVKAPITDHFGETEYHANILAVNATVDLTFANQSNYRVIDLPTSYNGLCKIIKFDFKLEPMKWMMINLKENRTYDLFLGRKDLEFQFVNQDQTSAPAWFKVDSTICIELEVVTFDHGDDTRNCAPVSTKEYGQCILDALGKRLLKQELKCLPIIFAKFLSNLLIPTCQKSEEATTAVKTVMYRFKA